MNQIRSQNVDEVDQTWVQSVGSPTLGSNAEGLNCEASIAISAEDIQSELPDKMMPKNNAEYHLSVATRRNPKMSASANSTQDINDLLLAERRRSSLLAQLGVLFMRGVCTMFAGVILGWFLPICKGLWTPSFTLYSAGISMNVLGILFFVYDIAPVPITTSPPLPSPSSYAGRPSWSTKVLRICVQFQGSLTSILLSCGQGITQALIWYGRNPTLIYVLTEVVKLILDKIHVDGKYDWIQTVWSYLFFNSFITFMPAPWASLVYSLVYIAIFAPLMWFLNKKGIYLRV
ncbi:hypothetical protein BGZ98_007798 [Dissophora globulifera]|nr:hypothetical protein BGZ98_007798 [Dissophora globulifera]